MFLKDTSDFSGSNGLESAVPAQIESAGPLGLGGPGAGRRGSSAVGSWLDLVLFGAPTRSQPSISWDSHLSSETPPGRSWGGGPGEASLQR